jgi:hypothetical protein
MRGVKVITPGAPVGTLEEEVAERHEVYESMRPLYQAYVQHLLLSAAGAAAIAALGATLFGSSEIAKMEPFWKTFITVGIILIPVLCISWAGGWAYLNLELWAHRHYLTYLELRAAEMGTSTRLYLYPHVIEGVIYQARPARRILGSTKPGLMSYHSHLDLLVAMFPTVAGLISMGFGAYLLWDKSAWYWRIAAVLYAITMLSLYVRVFYIKIVVSSRLKERLGIVPSSKFT